MHRSRLPIGSVALSLAVTLATACGDANKIPVPATSPEAAAPDTAQVVATTARPEAAAPTRGDGSFQRIAVDDTGLGAPMTAFTIEVPAAWRPYGGIRWNRDTPCITNQTRVQFGAGTPDRSHAVEILPAFGWQLAGYAQQTNPCPVAPFASVRDYLQAVVQQTYPGANVVGYRERPDLLAESGGATPPTAQPNMRAFNDAGEVTLAYPVDGQEMRTTLAAVANFTELGSSRMGYVGRVWVVRAPKDEYDGALGERIRQSIKTDPQWGQALVAYGKDYVDRYSSQQSADISAWHNKRMAEINAKGASDRAAIRSNTAREVADINAAGYASRQASQDRMHRNNVDTIREVQRYQDPSTNRQVELSSHYNYGYRTGNGTYVATDDPNFNPGANGQQMQRAP